jgi:hypothetical protein
MEENKNKGVSCCGCEPQDAIDGLSSLRKAQNLEMTAANREEVLKLIDAYALLVKTDPQNYNALWKTGHYHILMGAAYAANKAEKKHHYSETIKYCEKAMMLHQGFNQKTGNGAAIWEAVDQLDINYTDAMGYWYTARFYYFKECLSAVGRIFKTKMVLNNNPVIERIDELDPNWAGGGNFLSRAIYYIAVPEKFGGSKIKAAEELDKAIKAGPDYLVNRWGRAKYLYSLTGNKQGYLEDLNWVLAQDPHNSGNTYPWNVYFQRQSEEMLKNVNKLFK